MFSKIRWMLTWSGLVFALGGCTEANPRLAVRGTVTFQGQPLDQGNIQFLTTQGPPGPAAGGIVKEGKFDIPQAHGLAPGSYRVLINSTTPAKTLPPGWQGSPPTVERLPPEYSSFQAAKTVVEVQPPGPVVLEFTIP